MIPIHSIAAIKLVDGEILRDCLRKEFKRLPNDYIYPDYGYFIVIESLEELQHPIPLKHYSLPYAPEPLSDYLEIIEKFDGYYQIVFILEADFGISLFITCDKFLYQKLNFIFHI